MTDPPDPPGPADLPAQAPPPRPGIPADPLTQADIDAGERYAGPHDPGPGEQYAGGPVADPWEEVPDGELDPGAVSGQFAD